MEDNVDTNKILENHDDSVEFQFKYNFINTPWDDRSNKSKAGIVALLISIFIATMACVANNFVMHYRGFKSNRSTNRSEMNCLRVKIEEYQYVARIYSSEELLCVGAVLSPTSILANGVCAKSGPVRVLIGSPIDPHCKKGFTVDVNEPVKHNGSLSQKLVILSSFENMKECAHQVQIGSSLDWKSQVLIIGRPLNIGRTLSRQYVTLVEKEFLDSVGVKNLNTENMICVKVLGRCPVRFGDLLVQDGRLYGLAATSVHVTGPFKVACFFDLSAVHNHLKQIDTKIKV